MAFGMATTQVGGPREVELGAAVWLAATGVALGAQTLRVAPRFHGVVRGLLLIAGVSLIAAPSWSGVYAAGQYGLIQKWSIPFMVHWHGAVNAVGVALCGLFGWHPVVTAHKTVSPALIHPYSSI